MEELTQTVRRVLEYKNLEKQSHAQYEADLKELAGMFYLNEQDTAELVSLVPELQA